MLFCYSACILEIITAAWLRQVRKEGSRGSPFPVSRERLRPLSDRTLETSVESEAEGARTVTGPNLSGKRTEFRATSFCAESCIGAALRLFHSETAARQEGRKEEGMRKKKKEGNT